MALSKTDPVTVLTDTTIGASSASPMSSPAVDSNNVIQLAVDVTVTWGSVPTKGCRLDCYASYDGGTTYDTNPFASYDIPFPTLAGTYGYTFGVSHSPRYIGFKVANVDTTVSVSGVEVKYQKQIVT